MQKPIYAAVRSVRPSLRTGDGTPSDGFLAEDPGTTLDSSKANTLDRLYEIIDVQREKMASLDSLLGCLVIAMEYSSEADKPPYFPDVVQMARDLVQQSVRTLEPLMMPARAMNKVKEEPRILRAQPVRAGCDAIRVEAV